jgi:hypothetical protein
MIEVVILLATLIYPDQTIPPFYQRNNLELIDTQAWPQRDRAACAAAADQFVREATTDRGLPGGTLIATRCIVLEREGKAT